MDGLSLMTEKPLPKPLAIVICDTIIDDRSTSKKTLVGTFNQIGASALPCQHGEFHVYAALTDGHGSYASKLVIHHRESGRTVFGMQGPIAFTDPKQVVELTFVLKRVVFPVEGAYDIELLCDERHVIARSLSVSLVASSPAVS